MEDGTSGTGDDVGKGCRSLMWWKYYVFMYENRKMWPAKMIAGMGRGGIKETAGGSKFNYDML
jgi:hypothetical protein